MQKTAFFLALLLCVSQGRRLQSPSANRVETSDSSDALAKLLISAKPSVAFSANIPGAAAAASRSFVGQRRCLGRYIKLMDGQMDESDFEDDDYDVPEFLTNAQPGYETEDWHLREFFEVDSFKEEIGAAKGYYTGAVKIGAGKEIDDFHNLYENSEVWKNTHWRGKRGYQISHDEDVKGAYQILKDSIEEFDKTQFKENDKVKAKVVDFEEGGVMVEIPGAKSMGFIPNRFCTNDADTPASNLLEIGQEVEAEVIEMDSVWDGSVRLSMQDEFNVLSWQKINEQFSKDVTINATIRGVTPAGVAMSVFGIPAFLPISHTVGEITEDDVGKKLECKYLDVDPNSDRIVLSNRRAMADKNLEDMAIGKVVSGIVRSIMPYGVFVDVNGMSGLLHQSQVSMDHVEQLEAILPIGSTVRAMVINQDKARGRVALSTKTLEEQPGDMIRNPQKVFANADSAALKYQERMEEEKKAREDAAQDVLFGLQALTDGLGLKQEDLKLGGFGSMGGATPPAPAPAAEEELGPISDAPMPDDMPAMPE